MNRITRRIFCSVLLALIAGSAAVAVHAQSFNSAFSLQTLTVVPAPMVFSIGIVIGLALGFGFLSVGVRLSRLYK